jgi:branched-chain amino acid transport system substrate-binding protein
MFDMRKGIVAGLAFAAVMSAQGAADAQELRIGFLSNTTGGGAIMGRRLENGWRLGLDQHGWKKDGDKLGGVPTRIFYADDQARPDVGLREVEKFLRQERTQIIAGVVWGNVLMAITPSVLESKALLVSALAAASPLAAERCTPYYVSTAFANDQNSEATGELMSREGIKRAYVMVPNYQPGKDHQAGFERTFKGEIIGRSLFKVGETDFQADIAKLRAAKPDALFIFAPAAMGIAFMKQWVTSGLEKDVKLYTDAVIDYSTLGAIGDAAIGTYHTSHWDPSSKDERNQAFIKAYVAKYNVMPAFYDVHGYDAVTVIAQAMIATKGNTEDMLAVARAIRTGSFDSPRGRLRFNVNGNPIQPYYKLEVVRGSDGKPFIQGAGMVFNRPDSAGERCPAQNRIQ